MSIKILNSTAQFVTAFADINNSPDNLFCFILGAGASFSSGIPTGSQLAKKWYEEIKATAQLATATAEEFERWKTKKSIDEANISFHYSDIYEERFRVHKKAGYDELNRLMEGKIPSFGYSVLAQIMANEVKPHNVVITTNFDNLVEDGLYTYTQKRPLVCGHELLASFANPSRSRPLIVKIHRDRMLAPFSETEQIGKLDDLWVQALNEIFRRYIPIVIGYGGNDGSLMGYLKQINKCENFFWCVRKGEAVRSDVKEVLHKQDGWLVEIEGFDELMLQLHKQLTLPELGKMVLNDAEKRAEDYNRQMQALVKRVYESPKAEKETKEAAENIKETLDEDNPIHWALRAFSMESNQEREKVYKQALDKFPEDAGLHEEYALFLSNVMKNYPEAKKMFLKAIELAPDQAYVYGNYALFLKNKEADYSTAETNYLKAIELGPNDGDYYCNYANYLSGVKQDFPEAEKNYLKAIKLNPNKAEFYGNYANFLHADRKDYQEAERNYIKAIELGANTGTVYGNYAVYLNEIKKDYESAEKYYKKALEFEIETPNIPNNYAVFLVEKYKKSGDKAYLDEALKMTYKANEIKEGAGLYNTSCIYLKLKNYENAFKFLELALTLKDINKEFVEKDQDWDDLRKDSRYKKIMSKF